MKAVPPNAIEGYPCYRLTSHFEIIRFVGYENAKPENQGSYYGDQDEAPELLGSGINKEAALAILRLLEVEEFEDWSK